MSCSEEPSERRGLKVERWWGSICTLHIENNLWDCKFLSRTDQFKHMISLSYNDERLRCNKDCSVEASASITSYDSLA